MLIVTKGCIEDCNTRHAQGGIAAAIGENDSAALHFKDTIAAGAGLCYEEAVRILTEAAPDRIADLVNFGVPFDTASGMVALTREAAHSLPRILHAGGDATGAHIENTLSQRVREAHIPLLEHCLALDILLDNGRVAGLHTVDCRTGIFQDFNCRFLLLATGGAGQLFRFTTNPDVATGDGIALAYRAGAEITDMEFFQFHPTALHMPGVSPFLISEAVRGEGGILRNASGMAFMTEYTLQAELAPRDVVARSIAFEMQKSGTDHVFLDVTHLPSNITAARFPNIYRFCLEHGIDITRDMIPVAPAAHYMIGGVRVDTWGQTSLPGLYAVGETACTGVHGANRLASNSMMEVLVFSKRIIERTLSGEATGEIAAWNGDMHCSLRQPNMAAVLPPLNLAALQKLLWDEAGIVRDGQGLEQAAVILAGWQAGLPQSCDRASWELSNLVLAGRLMVESALMRCESRGAHYRSDFPGSSDAWRKHIIQIKGG